MINASNPICSNLSEWPNYRKAGIKVIKQHRIETSSNAVLFLFVSFFVFYCDKLFRVFRFFHRAANGEADFGRNEMIKNWGERV